MAHERKTYQAEFSRKIIKFAKIKPTMKLFSQRMIGIGVLSLSLAASLKVAAHDWPEATLESRPGSRWWWLGSAVDSANLAKNISEYAKAGIATLEVTPIYGVKGNEANDIPYLSPKWMKMLDIACRKGAKHGIRIELNNGTGWPFGGPDVTKEDAAKKAVFRRVAKPEGAGDTIILEIANTMQKVKRAAPGGEGLVVDHLDKGAVGMYLSKFDSAFSKAGMAFPEVLFSDSYELYGADWTPTLLEEFYNRRGYRLEDHYKEFTDMARGEKTRRIVGDYRRTMSELLLDNFLRPWTEWAHSHGAKTRNQAHGSPANLIDAYAAVDIPECEGFGLSDFGIKGLRKDSIAKRNDSDISMLKYASSAANITGKKLVSSETFTWLTDHFRTSLSQCKPDMDLMLLGGVNHMYFHGTPYSPEEAPWPGWRFYASINMSPTNPMWHDAPAFFDYITRCQSMLQQGSSDNDFLLYIPIEDIWDNLPGRMVAFDIHKMKQRAPGFIGAVNSIMKEGYNVDYISDALLLATSEENGRIQTVGGASYSALVVPEAKLMPLSSLEKILELAREGSTVAFVGGLPVDVPGFYQLESRRRRFADIVKDIDDEEGVHSFGKGRIIVADDYKKALAITGVAEEELMSRHGLGYIRRAVDGGHLYFISNLQPKDVDAYVAINKLGKVNVLFNPMDGERGAVSSRAIGEKERIRLQLRSGESMILRSFDDTTGISALPVWHYQEKLSGAITLNHGWKLHFSQSEPAIEGTFEIDSPKSWTELDVPQSSVNMGRGVYSVEFQLRDINCDDWILDIGDVRESARIRINGKDVATLWAVPFTTSVGGYLRKGKNRIEVEVTNLPANRIAEMDRQGIEWRVFKDANIARLGRYKGDFSSWTAVASGLNGEVKLQPIRKTR